MREPYFTTCRRCGKKILMIYSPDTAKWIPCDAELKQFKPSGGPETYVNQDGNVVRGERVYKGEYGHRKHRKDCDKI